MIGIVLLGALQGEQNHVAPWVPEKTYELRHLTVDSFETHKTPGDVPNRRRHGCEGLQS